MFVSDRVSERESKQIELVFAKGNWLERDVEREKESI